MSDERLAPIREIAADAADAAMRFRAPGARVERQWEKEPGQLVCEADLMVDALLRERLGALLPDAGLGSPRESAETPGRAENAPWPGSSIPSMGTRDFVRGRPGWAVSVALVEDGEVAVGVLAAPARGELWWAARGEGSWLQWQAIALRFASYPVEGTRAADHLRGVDVDYVLVPKPNSIALRMAMVAADEADAVASFRGARNGTSPPRASSRRKAGRHRHRT